MVEVGLAVALAYLELVPEVEGDRRAVEPRAEVRRARGRAHAREDGHDDASAIASGSGSTTTGGGLERAADAGSLRP